MSTHMHSGCVNYKPLNFPFCAAVPKGYCRRKKRSVYAALTGLPDCLCRTPVSSARRCCQVRAGTELLFFGKIH